jgi:trehalose 6-phosphate synthase/phosphatase
MRRDKILTKSKRIFVSNRLPFNINSKTGALQRGSGGLVSALIGVHLDEPFFWLGFETDAKVADQLSSKAGDVNKNLRLKPVLLDKKLYSGYYDGFCNDVLWPLFHYESNNVFFRKKDWQSYKDANRIMAEAILKEAVSGDTVWLHDFHFMLLPGMLKEADPSLKIGFFLHTPFPSSEIFRQLPVREEVLKSMIQCDLIGFHEHSYLKHFATTIKALLGIDSGVYTADLGEHTLKMGVYPISIDIDEMREKASAPKIAELADKFRRKIKSNFLILGVDRLDYTKGIELKLRGFSRLLEKYPELRGQVNLLQVAVPTRTNVPSYMKLRQEIEQLVGAINGEYGQPGYVPVQYMFRSISEADLLALYRRSECVLITSKRDGMNLVAMEYAVCQSMATPGLIALSEFAGAASLLAQALFLNPWDEDSIANALYRAYTMPLDERKARLEGLNSILSKYSATQWAESFLGELEKKTTTLIRRGTKQISERSDSLREISRKIAQGGEKILILDYDGTLVSLQNRPMAAVLPSDIKALLEDLSTVFKVYIISGRPKEFLESQFTEDNLTLVAEHGAYSKKPNEDWKTHITSDIQSWLPEAKKAMDEYARRVPLSFVETKNAAVVWHFRQSPPAFGEYQAKKLDEELQVGLANKPVSVTFGSKIVEARATECNKGNFVRSLLESAPDSTLICIGDDITDEDMFKQLNSDHISIKVGPGHTVAQYRLNDQPDVRMFLEYLKKQVSSRHFHSEEHSNVSSSSLLR